MAVTSSAGSGRSLPVYMAAVGHPAIKARYMVSKSVHYYPHVVSV